MGMSDAQAEQIIALLKTMNDFAAHDLTPNNLEYISIAQVAAAGVVTIHADTAGSSFLLMGVQGTLSTDNATLQFREADDSPVYSGAMEFLEGGGICMPVAGYRYWRTADGKGLELVTVGGGFNGSVQFLEVPNLS